MKVNSNFSSLKSISCRDVVWLESSDWEVSDADAFANLFQTSEIRINRGFHLKVDSRREFGAMSKKASSPESETKTWLLKSPRSTSEIEGWFQLELSPRDFRIGQGHFSFVEGDAGRQSRSLSLLISAIFISERLDRLQWRMPEQGTGGQAFLEGRGEVKLSLAVNGAQLIKSSLAQTDRVLWWEHEQSQSDRKNLSYLIQRVNRMQSQRVAARAGSTRKVGLFGKLFGGKSSRFYWENFSKRNPPY